MGCVPVPRTKQFYVPSGAGTIKGDEPYLGFHYPDETLGYFSLLPRAFQDTTLLVHLRPRSGVSLQLSSATLQFSVCGSQSWQSIVIPDFPINKTERVSPTSVVKGFEWGQPNAKNPEMDLWSYGAMIKLPGRPECFEVKMPDMLLNGQKLSFGTVRFLRVEKTFVDAVGFGT